jgi:hypothetical protein
MYVCMYVCVYYYCYVHFEANLLVLNINKATHLKHVTQTTYCFVYSTGGAIVILTAHK